MAEQNNGTIEKRIGPVTAYAVAVANGYTGTEQQWATEIANASTNAQAASVESLKAEGYATGKQNGTAVGSNSPYYENNADYYAKQAKAWADGDVASTKPQYGKSAKDWAEATQDIAEDIAQEDTAQDIKDEILGIGGDVEEILNIQRSIRYYSELPAQGTDGYVYITPDGIFYYDGTEDEYRQISGNDSLNGFSFAKNNSNQVVMTYTNPEDETDTAEAVMPTNTTLQAVLTEMQGITADLMLIAGGNT